MRGDNRIDILIAKFLSGEALPIEAMELEDWMNASSGNRDYFDRYATLLDLSPDVSNTDKSLAWKNISDAIDCGVNEPKPNRIFWWAAGIAASVQLIIVIVLLTKTPTIKENGPIVFTTEGISSKKVILKDQSEVIVSPNSSILVDKEFGVHNRRITLHGSATFIVNHQPFLPLIVDMDKLYIKDIGTTFSVVKSPIADTIFITVAAGAIAVYDEFGSSENASAGEKVLYIQSKRKIVVLPGKHEETKRPDPIKKIARGSSPTPAPGRDISKRDTGRAIPFVQSAAIDEEKEDRSAIDTTPSQKIATDLVRDRLIIRGHPLNFTLTDTAFILNGTKQGAAVFKRYLEKYGGPLRAPGYSWHHADPGYSVPPAQRIPPKQ